MLRITLIDRYVIRASVLSTLVCIAAFTGLYVVVDAFGRLDDFLREMKTWSASVRFMFRYYALHLPLIMLHVMPFAVLMGALFALARLEKHNELLAAKACGISLRRLMAPLLVLACLFCAFTYINKQWIIPYLAEDIEESEQLVRRKGKRMRDIKDLFLHDSSGRWYVITRYNPATTTCYDTWIISDDSEGRKIRYAAEAVIQNSGLLIKRGTDLSRQAESSTPLKDYLIPTNLCADDFIARAGGLRFRSYTNLMWLLARNPRARDVAVLLHKNLAFPLIILIIPLIGVSVMFVRENMGALTAVGIAILMCFMYFVVDNLCYEAARQGFLSPQTGGWAPVGMFSAAGIYLFTRIRT